MRPIAPGILDACVSAEVMVRAIGPSPLVIVLAASAPIGGAAGGAKPALGAASSFGVSLYCVHGADSVEGACCAYFSHGIGAALIVPSPSYSYLPDCHP